jgi:hypothetical protein
MLTNKKQTEVTVAETGFFENHETILPAANGFFAVAASVCGLPGFSFARGQVEVEHP